MLQLAILTCISRCVDNLLFKKLHLNWTDTFSIEALTQDEIYINFIIYFVLKWVKCVDFE